MTNANAGKIGIDWGSSSFRAYRFDQKCSLVDTIESSLGIKHVIDGAFEEQLFSQLEPWLQQDDIVLLSGMITSRNGWVETPYIPLPAAPKDLIGKALKRMIRNTNLVFLPGLSQLHPRPDVLRGEELQLFGATQTMDNALVVMPGTHSKWAQLRDGEVVAFQTIVTGELFDVLLNNTLVGQLATEKSLNKAIFKQGVLQGFESTQIVSELFQCRSGVLLGKFAEQEVHSYLSGLLIGNEISEALPSAKKDDQAIVLVGSDALCDRYQIAFECLQINATRAESTTTSTAFAQLLALL